MSSAGRMLSGISARSSRPLQAEPRASWGYHKPIMIAGGIGNIRASDVHKSDVPAGALLIVLGGPAMLIGLGGGAASSMGSGTSTEDLDFASVQRGNPEMQRRAQQVIDACWATGLSPGGANPLLLIHDVGAGGLSNAVPELVDHSHRGGKVEIREIPNAEPAMSPAEIWCNEAQERYVLAIEPADLAWFREVCERERCPFAVIGSDRRFAPAERHRPVASGNRRWTCRWRILLGHPPRTVMRVARVLAANRQRPTIGTSIRSRRACACCGFRPSRTSRSSFTLAIARSVAWLPAISWWAHGRCPSATWR